MSVVAGEGTHKLPWGLTELIVAPSGVVIYLSVPRYNECQTLSA